MCKVKCKFNPTSCLARRMYARVYPIIVFSIKWFRRVYTSIEINTSRLTMTIKNIIFLASYNGSKIEILRFARILNRNHSSKRKSILIIVSVAVKELRFIPTETAYIHRNTV